MLWQLRELLLAALRHSLGLPSVSASSAASTGESSSAESAAAVDGKSESSSAEAVPAPAADSAEAMLHPALADALIRGLQHVRELFRLFDDV